MLICAYFRIILCRGEVSFPSTQVSDYNLLCALQCVTLDPHPLTSESSEIVFEV